MKKRLLALLLALSSVLSCGFCEENDWAAAPVITHAYEMTEGKLFLQWTGSAPVYQVYMDGESAASVIVTNAVIDIKKGTHAIYVYPINEDKTINTQFDVGLSASKIAGNISIDLAALGLDPKDLTAGTPSAPLNIDYTPSAIFDAAPEQLVAVTDFDNHVSISFTDRYYADEYLLSVKLGKDTNYVKFNIHDETAQSLITRTNSTVTLLLDPAFLQSQECMVPELNEKYTFTVQLRKYAKNMLDGTAISTVIHESKQSKAYQYTPTAAWKTAPVITYASQTADGQITLNWTHDDNGLGCEYAILKIKKTLGIKRGEEELAVTSDKSFVLNDLMNGDYYISVMPRLNGETGNAAEDKEVKLQNDWVVAPELSCEQIADNQIKLSWTSADKVETYHIIVSKGDNDSLLRFVSLDYSKYAEYDLAATPGAMEFIFTYNGEIDVEYGEKFKFEILGVRHTANGEEQKTASSTQTITLKTNE